MSVTFGYLSIGTLIIFPLHIDLCEVWSTPSRSVIRGKIKTEQKPWVRINCIPLHSHRSNSAQNQAWSDFAQTNFARIGRTVPGQERTHLVLNKKGTW